MDLTITVTTPEGVVVDQLEITEDDVATSIARGYLGDRVAEIYRQAERAKAAGNL